MPRVSRVIAAEACYHVINRANSGACLFRGAADFRNYLELIAGAQERISLRLIAACLMPNHFHFVLVPGTSDDLGRWMQWLQTTHVRRHHKRSGTNGHLWQGRYKAFPIQRDEHLLSVMRYVERNALRAGLVDKAQDWPWGSLAWRSAPSYRGLLAPCPVELPHNWSSLVNIPQSTAEVATLRVCVNRQRPYGSDDWVNRTATDLGLEPSLRSVGRQFKDRRQ